MLPFFIFFILILFISPAGAGLLEDINNSFIDTVDELPQSEGNPEIVWQEGQYISAWIDIVGFKNMAFIDNAFFVVSNPDESAIVQYGVELKKVPGTYDGIDKSINIYQSNNNTIASLHTILKWHVTCCDKNGCWVCGRYREEKKFLDSEISPFIFNSSNEYIRVNDVYYNHSFIIKRFLYLNYSSLITAFNVSIANGSVNNRVKVAQIYYTRKGIPYANYSFFSVLDVKGKGIRTQNEAVVIDDINEVYKVEAYSPFGVLNITPNIYFVNKSWTPEKTFPQFTFLFVFIIITAFLAIYFMWR